VNLVVTNNEGAFALCDFFLSIGTPGPLPPPLTVSIVSNPGNVSHDCISPISPVTPNPPIIITFGQTLTLSADASGGESSAYLYAWTSGEVTQMIFIPTFTLGTFPYIVSVSDGFNAVFCSIDVIVISSINITVRSDLNTSIPCESSINLNIKEHFSMIASGLDGDDTDFTYQWTVMGGPSLPPGPKVKVITATPGAFIYTVTVTSQINPANFQTCEITVNVKPHLCITVKLNYTNTISCDCPIDFNCNDRLTAIGMNGMEPYNYIWTLPNKKLVHHNNIKVMSAGTYIATVIDSDDNTACSTIVVCSH
jgi:hypothetical protein